MTPRLPLLLCVLVACAPLCSAEEQPTTPKPGLLKRVTGAIWPFGKKPADAQQRDEGKTWRKLVPSLTVTPEPVKLSDVRTFKVTLQLLNEGRKLVQLDFPTTQRIEVLVKDQSGKRIEQWSEDQAFENEPTLVTINPGERLEYVANVATRDLKAGETYVIEAFFPNFEQLRASRTLVPQP